MRLVCVLAPYRRLVGFLGFQSDRALAIQALAVAAAGKGAYFDDLDEMVLDVDCDVLERYSFNVCCVSWDNDEMFMASSSLSCHRHNAHKH